MRKTVLSLMGALSFCVCSNCEIMANNVVEDEGLYEYLGISDDYDSDLERSSVIDKNSLVYLDADSVANADSPQETVEETDSYSDKLSVGDYSLENMKDSISEDSMLRISEVLSKQETVNEGIVSRYVNEAMFKTMLISSIDKSALTKKQRKALKDINKISAGDWDLALASIISKANAKSLWIRPYAAYEKVKIKSGRKVENTGYGIYAGGESELYELGDGWDAMFGVYAGYNGSHQAWNGNDAWQNGGNGAIEGTIFKGNFFDTLTIGAGATYGHGSLYRNISNRNYKATDSFGIFNAGAANKLGYNFEFKEGKYVLQPSFLISLTYLLTLNSNIDYWGGGWNNENLFALEIEPGLKFIGNISDSFQYYLTVSVATNFLMNTRNFKAYEVTVPELSYRPYARYGAGIIKSFGDRFSGFLQAHITNGGRTGIGTQLGCRVSL